MTGAAQVPGVVRVDQARCELGEGAFWQAESGCLWWVDIRGGKLCRHRPALRETQSWNFAEWITRVIPLDESGERLRVTMHGALGVLDLAGGNPHFTPTYVLGQDGLRFNDGQVDPDGRWWGGTMGVAEDAPVGQWLRFDPDGRCAEVMAEGFTVTNGPCFDAARGTVYLTDSAAQTIYRGTYDAVVGVRALEPWRTFGEGDGYPDGMIMGPDGNLWIAFWDGACLRALDLDGKIRREVMLPVQRPTSLAFAAPDLAYVTSAAVGLADDGWQGRTIAVSLG